VQDPGFATDKIGKNRMLADIVAIIGKKIEMKNVFLFTSLISGHLDVVFKEIDR